MSRSLCLRYLAAATTLLSSLSVARDACPEVTGVCTDEDTTFPIPVLDLSLDSSQRPLINGIIDSDEYSSFLELPMFNGGKNGETGSPLDEAGRIGTAYLAYDHWNDIVCVAAHLSSTQVAPSEVEGWIQFGKTPDATKLIEGTAAVFEYVGTPDNSEAFVGYEGCWTINRNDPMMENILNNFIQVVFNRGTSVRASTGKAGDYGRLVCLTPTCPSTTTSTTTVTETSSTSTSTVQTTSTTTTGTTTTSEPTKTSTTTEDPQTSTTTGTTPGTSTTTTTAPDTTVITTTESPETTTGTTTTSETTKTSTTTEDPQTSTTTGTTPGTSTTTTTAPDTTVITTTESPETTTGTTTTSETTKTSTTTEDPQTSTTTRTTPGTSTTTTVAFDEHSSPSSSPTTSPSGTSYPSASPSCDYSTIDAINNKVTTPVNTPIDVRVLDNDITSSDGSLLDISYILFRGTSGECTITNDGTTITYTPNPDFFGTDTCIYTACDEMQHCDSAAVIIIVTPVIASDDSVTTEINTPVDIFATENDIFADGHPLTIVSIEENAHNGDCIIASQKIVIYIPDPNFHGSDSCKYQACDDRGICDSAIINITIDGTPCDEDDIITGSPVSSSPVHQPVSSPPTQHPTAKPVTPAPVARPTTSQPTMAPTPCGPRSFFFSGGVCTNGFDKENDLVYSTLIDCCNANYDSGCCRFEDVCYDPPTDDFIDDDPNEACYEPWRSKAYQVGDKVTGKDGKNYACNADFFLYCSWAAFEPGTGSSVDYYQLAWDELPTKCHTQLTKHPSPSPVSTLIPPVAPPVSCPEYFDKFARHYSAGDLSSYNGMIYQCITSNGRCNQDGYEPWSPLSHESWVVVGSCNGPQRLRMRRV
eukprot:CCRYP_013973-RA/>CCRYP_013973-RA protein AED:0.71 eAED:1.00 QI:0/0/0/0.66/1/1/3/0/869